MDLARFVKIPLDDATVALIFAQGHDARLLEAFGFTIPHGADPLAFIRSEVAGQAQSYTSTISGSLEVFAAQRSPYPGWSTPPGPLSRLVAWVRKWRRG